MPLYPNLAHAIDTVSYEGFAVLPEYLDRNGHMNIGYYSVIFDQALDLPWPLLGLGYDNIGADGHSGHSDSTKAPWPEPDIRDIIGRWGLALAAFPVVFQCPITDLMFHLRLFLSNDPALVGFPPVRFF